VAVEHQDFTQAQERIRESKLVDHSIHHPNAPHAAQAWSQDKTLHVAVAYSNPCRWKTRRNLFNDFRRHLATLPNVKLYVGELAYGERPFEVTSADHPNDLQMRTREELWHKENILNATIQRLFPVDWQYGAYVDGDCHFTRVDIGLETIHQLQHFDWVQMYSTYSDLSPNHHPMRVLKSFAYRYVNGELSEPQLAEAAKGGYYGTTHHGVGTTGLAWAFRRESFNACGGLLDTCILGSGDWHMAFGLASTPDWHPQVAELEKVTPTYANAIKIWQSRSARAVNKNIGVVDCHAIHYFHGSKQRRGYGTRWKILADGKFDPYTDLFRDWQGIWQLANTKPRLRDEIRKYFRSRIEDDISLMNGDTLLGETGRN